MIKQSPFYSVKFPMQWIKRNIWPLSLILLVVVFFVLASQNLMPKNFRGIGFFGIFLLLDIYLWASVKSKLQKLNRIFYGLLAFLFWFPFALLIGIFSAAFIEPFQDWDYSLRSYLIAIVLVGYLSKLLPFIFLLISDSLSFIVWLFSSKSIKSKRSDLTQKGKIISRSAFLKNIGWIGGGVVFSGMLMGMLKWVYDFKIHKVRMPLSNLPKAFDGMKIVQISDFHLGSWSGDGPVQDAVDLINSLHPDLIFFTGDLVNYETGEARRFQKILEQLKASKGIYAVLGNHDYGDYIQWPSEEAKARNLQNMKDMYAEMGWKLLNNTNEILSAPGGDLAIIGVENWGAHLRFPKIGKIEEALKGTENASVKLLLSHDPSHWDQIVSKDYQDIDLTFSGHTHGAQFGIEIPHLKWSPAQYFYKQWAGLYQNDAKPQYLYVNRGIGHIGYPGRIGIRPEVTLMELVVGG